MIYRVNLEFGDQSRTHRYSTVTEARKSADQLAADYAPEFGQATTTVFDRSGDEIYIRVRNARPYD